MPKTTPTATLLQKVKLMERCISRIGKLLYRGSMPSCTRLGVVVVLFLLSFSQLAAPASCDDSSSTLAIQPQQVLDWILLHPGAIFNEKQEIERRISGSGGEREYVVHAKRPIQKNEILFQVPWDLILSAPDPKPKAAKSIATKDQKESLTKETTSNSEEDEEDEEDEDSDDEPLYDEEEDEMLVNCELVKLLQEELINHQNRKGTEKTSSLLGPYLDYITYKTKQQSKVPSTFTEAGQDLFVDLLLDWAPEEERDRFRAPPVDSIFVAYECSAEDDSEDDDEDYDEMIPETKDVVKEEDTVEVSTTMWVVQNSDNRVLVPLVQDLYPHGNGANANNTKIQWKEGEYYQVLASRDINEGEILKHSLNLCSGCLATEKGRAGRRTYENYGTAELFRDYGFVEDYPQIWLLDDCTFEIDVVDAITAKKEGSSHIIVDGKDLQVSWITPVPEEQELRNEVIKYLFGLHRRLVRSRNRAVNLYYPDTTKSGLQDSDDDSGSEDEEDAAEYEFEYPTIPFDEWDLMLKYYDTITSAVAIAHNSLVSDSAVTSGISPLADSGPDTTESCSSENGIQTAISHYDDLNAEEDDLDYVTPKCSEEEWMQFRKYKEIESVRTPYHQVNFFGEPETGDVCMNLDTSLHICTSYRPQHHDMMVHYPARFLKSIKRVLIVGGGTSMLLNEVLKYNTLKQVVVLELDQTITRKSFKHFHSQPHFHNDLVEWWFGDISKSLLHLLHGDLESFDLIVINQAEVIRSGSVARGLNTFETLALLLKADGVLVKNGRHMDHFGDTFEYAAHVHYHAPKICSQTIVFASKTVDFIHHVQKEHGVAHHFLLTMDEMEDQFDYMHDYHKNNSPRKCTWSLANKSSDARDATSPYSIHRVIDIENISRSDFELKDLLHKVARSARLHPVSTPIGSEGGKDNVSTVVLLEEGYISARLWTSERYLAVGVNLWSAYDKLAILEDKLVQKLGTKSKSSFQVFVSAMNESMQSALLEPKQKCVSHPVAKRTSNVVGGRGTLRPVITEVLNLVFSEQIVAGVVCLSPSRPCMAKEVLEANPRISQVIVIWTCTNIQTTEDKPSTLSNMVECERIILEQLDVTMDEDGLYFDIFVVDNSAPREMAQIFNSIWSNPKYREWYLTENNNIFLGISLRPPEENYHRQMLDRYRRHIRYDPINRAELLIEIDGARMEIDVVSAGDVYAFYNLQFIESRIQKKIGKMGKVEVQYILGGQREYKEDNEYEEFTHELYNDAQSVKHYQTQKPLGRETIFQYGINPPPNKPMTVEKLTKHLQLTLEKVGFKDVKLSTHSVADNGFAMVYSSQSFSIILVWNGMNTINVNLFSRDTSQDTANDFWESFEQTADGIPFFLTNRDDYPRGTGRVVNFDEDIVPLDNK
ncbi:unnamed protein product [Cylindrotheca closterium]|uniref:PABS domain-containing protein n=1 Tax=Cylindrotheca closterium TaxID=2856 RepID=A0AAD2G7V7_9STRA|nr:unnamed protein product [Cylindrotheca closterium]